MPLSKQTLIRITQASLKFHLNNCEICVKKKFFRDVVYIRYKMEPYLLKAIK